MYQDLTGHPQTLPIGVRGRILGTLVRAELGAGIFGLKLFIACVTVATLMMGSVWMLGDGLTRALDRGGTMFLGGDVAVTVVNVPLPPETRTALSRVGTLSQVAELRSSAMAGTTRAAVEIKGVDNSYPLYGVVRLDSGRPLQRALTSKDGVPSAVVEPSLLSRTGAAIGDLIALGTGKVRIADTLVLEPDRLSAGRFMVGPRVLMRLEDLEKLGLVQRGSIVEFRYRIRALAGTTADQIVDATRALTPETGWEFETPRDAGDRVRRTVGRTTTFLGMTGIVALVIGLAGSWSAARAWVARRARTIALYRLSGATPGTVMALHGVIVSVASFLGLLTGLSLSAALVLPLMETIAARLHLVWSVPMLFASLAQVAWLLVLGIAGTGLLALSAAGRISPGEAMRSGEAETAPDRRHAMVAIALIAAACIGATISLPIPKIAAAAIIGLVVSVGFLWLAAAGLARTVSRLNPEGFIWVIAREGLAKASSVAPRAVSIGIGIAGITAIVAAQTSLEQALRSELPERIPDVVLIDVQPNQVDDIRRRIDANASLDGLLANPFMRMTITAVNGVPAAKALKRADKSWVIEGDRSFSWTAEPTGAELLAGEWWKPDYNGPPLLSPEEDLQEAFDLKPGDTLSYSVLGRSFTSTIVNIRKEYHRTFRPEYLLMASPNPFRNAPQSWIMSFQGKTDDAVDSIIRTLGTAHPNVTSIDIRRIVTQVTEVIDGAVFGSLMVAIILVIAGGLSLAAVIAADVDGRRREAVIYSLLGARRGEVALARLVEATGIGLIAALLGGGFGYIGGLWAVERALHVAWSPSTAAIILPLALGIVASVAAGLVGALGALPKGRGQMARHLTS
jgi:putative ABC transport system permease protein